MPTNTVVKQNIAKFYIKCGYVILELSMVQGTDTNEVHDLKQEFSSSPAERNLLLDIGHVGDKIETVRKRLRFSNSLTEQCNDSRIFGTPYLETIPRGI